MSKKYAIIIGLAMVLVAAGMPFHCQAQIFSIGSNFPIATTGVKEFSLGGAFDGENYLVGIQGDAALHYNVGAQLISRTGALIGPYISTGRTGGAPMVRFTGTHYLIAWPDDANPPHPNDVIYAQLINKTGAAVTSPFPVSTTVGVMDLKNVVCDGVRCTLIWADQNSTGTIYGRDISPTTGTFLTPEYLIASATRPTAGRVEVGAAADHGGNRLIAVDTGSQILGLIKGPTVNVNPFVIATKAPTGSCTDHNPVGVAFDGRNFLVVWNDHSDCADLPAWDILARRVDTAGNLMGGPFQVNSGNTHRAALPMIGFDGSNYLVAWTDYRNDANRDGVCDPGEGTCWDMYGRFINRAGSLVGSEFPINAESGNQFGPFPFFAGGQYLLVWTNGDSIWGSVGDVYGAFMQVPLQPKVDFDGDGRTDLSAFHHGTDQFFTESAGNLGQYGWGGADCYPLVWDYDGDGRTDVSIYHIPTNQWFVRGYPGDNLGQFGWSQNDCLPIPGDYNGDGIMERAFYHTPSNTFFIEGQGGPPTLIQFGWDGSDCIPVPGDYDGDGTTDLVIYHLPTNQWLRHGVGNLGQYGWNGADCLPVPADYNGDGSMDIAVYHYPTNQWFVKGYPGDNLGQYGWGGMESFPIPGDYNGDGMTERGFYRHGENWWFIEGRSDFVWGWGGQDFMPITSQTAVYNWFRFVLGRFP